METIKDSPLPLDELGPFGKEVFLRHGGSNTRRSCALLNRLGLRAILFLGSALLGISPSWAAPTIDSSNPNHWAFLPLQTTQPPATRHALQMNSAVDRFILATLESKGLTMAAEAPKRKLIRRLCFDLIGLPPAPEEVEAFVQDHSAGSYERLVDRLLASPHFGERWARHWLDVARYADSKGYERDGDRPTAYHYRDFVIGAFNDDLPFDTFIKWQLAGDEFAPDNPQARVATVFIGLGPVIESDTKLKDELARYRYADLDDMISTTGSAMLGLSIGCARCHDHKYDPIPTRDYYRMLSAFTTATRKELPLASMAELERHIKSEADHQQRLQAAQRDLDHWLTTRKEPLAPVLRARKIDGLKLSSEEKALLGASSNEEPRAKELAKKFEKELKLTDEDYRKAFTQDERAEWDQFSAVVKHIEGEKLPLLPTAMMVQDQAAVPEKNYLMARGDPTLPKEEVALGFLTVLSAKRSANDYLEQERTRWPATLPRQTTLQRAALAEWMTDSRDGAGHLLARVIVNRLWQHHFGEGLVRTPSDFGTQGERPSHPELLDWLASELIRNGWKLKPIHRLILLSATYRQDTTFNGVKAKIDPENRLLWHRRPVRLESEVLRDSILAVSGCLRTNMFGPGVKAPLPSEILLAAANLLDPYPKDLPDTAETWRRSIYLFTKRSLRQPLLEMFDGADPSASCARRIPTTVAPQGLAMLNDRFIRARAKDLAERVAGMAGEDRAARIKRAYNLVLSRGPSRGELTAAMKFLTQQATARFERRQDLAGKLALIDLCHSLLCLNEFVYID